MALLMPIYTWPVAERFVLSRAIANPGRVSQGMRSLPMGLPVKSVLVAMSTIGSITVGAIVLSAPAPVKMLPPPSGLNDPSNSPRALNDFSPQSLPPLISNSVTTRPVLGSAFRPNCSGMAMYCLPGSGTMKARALTNSGISSSSNPAAASISACITPRASPPARMRLPAGPCSALSVRAVPCTEALKKAYSGPSSRPARPLRLKSSVSSRAKRAASARLSFLSSAALYAARRTPFSSVVLKSSSRSSTACAAAPGVSLPSLPSLSSSLCTASARLYGSMNRSR